MQTEVVQSSTGTSRAQLMNHLEQNWTTVLNVHCQNEVLILSRSHPLMCSIILSLSASHLRHISPIATKHRIAEHFYQSLALQEYQRMLSLPLSTLGQEGVNALMLSAVLLNILAFTLPESNVFTNSRPDVDSSWVFSSREDRLGWLALQEGTRHLLRSTLDFIGPAVSFLGRIFLGPDQDPWAYSSVGGGIDTVPQRWKQFFSLGQYAETSSNVTSKSSESRASFLTTTAAAAAAATASPQQEAILPALMTLSHMSHMPAVTFNVFHSFPFLAKVHTGFRALLYNRDEKALWLFGYWLGTMSRYDDLWWCKDRARRDYRAVRQWLDMAHVCARPGVEGQMWREMLAELDDVSGRFVKI